MKKLIIALAGLLLLGAPKTAHAIILYDYFTNADMASVTITNCNASGNIIVPATLNNLAVTAIGDGSDPVFPFGPTSVTLPDSVLIIADAAFYTNAALTNITFGTNLASIGYESFYECYALSNVTIPNSVQTIGYSAFEDCIDLTNALIGTNVMVIDSYAFYGCKTLLNVTIPNNVTDIGEYAFYDCYDLTNVVLSTNLTSISDYAFYYCESLSGVSIPNSVTSIGEYAFYECYGLTNVSIAHGVIGEEAFEYCYGLTSLTIGDGVTSIGEYAFYHCESLTNASIASGVISYGAFEDCYDLTNLTIGDGVTSIGDEAFEECEDLTSVAVPKSVTSIGGYAFYECYGLTNASIASGVIGEEAFEGCYDLARITIGDGVTSIGEYAFYGCTNLPVVTIPKNVTSIGEGVFESCYALTNAIVANNMIGAYQFYDCPALETVTIAGSVSTLLEEPFWYCTNLTQVYFQGNAPTSDFSVFNEATNPSLKVYYFAGTTGWSSNFSSVPTMELAANSLTVTLGPSSAIAAGASWTLDGTATYTSPATLNNIAPGLHTVTFAIISGWTTPTSQTVTVTNDVAIGGIYVPTNRPASGLIILTNGSGAVAVTGSPKTFVVGKSYKITAVPAPGNLFVSWEGGTSQPFDVLSTAPAYTFTFESNLVLVATFVTNPFVAVSGTYNGLFITTEGATEATSGMLSSLIISTKGAYSGKLLINNASFGISGSFDISGNALNNIARKTAQGGPLNLLMTLSTDGSTSVINGTVSGTGFTANLIAEEANNQLPSTEYTMLIQPDTNNTPPTNSPGGDGYILITNNAGTVKNPGAAAAKMTGGLADGTTFSQTVAVSAEGYVPVYASLAGKGLVLGWINLNGNDASGTGLTWIHNQAAKGLYTAGFTNRLTGAQLPLAPWDASVLQLLTNLTVVDAIGDTNGFSSTIAVITAGKVTGSEASGTINPKTGLIKLTFGSGANKLALDGAALAGSTNGGGYFVTKTDAGGFTVSH